MWWRARKDVTAGVSVFAECAIKFCETVYGQHSPFAAALFSTVAFHFDASICNCLKNVVGSEVQAGVSAFAECAVNVCETENTAFCCCSQHY